MNIQEALKETGKATVEPNHLSSYVQMSNLVLMWYEIGINNADGPVALEVILGDNWQPYHEEKEIRPEKAGELWEWTDGYYHTEFIGLNDFRLIGKSCNRTDTSKVIHGKNGWTRLCPDAEELLEVRMLDSRQSYDGPIISVFNVTDTPITVKVFKS